MIRKLALAAASLGLALALAEVVLRFLYPAGIRPLRTFGLPFLAWDAFRGTYLVPNSQEGELRINSLGMRGPELDPERPRRIVCMGDSSTFGIWVEGVDPETRELHFDSYPQHLGEMVERAGYSAWQVVNAGVPGSTAAHSLRMLRRQVLELEPEIVTLRVGVNDHAAALLPWIHEPDSRWLRSLLFAAGRSKLFQLSVEARFQLRKGERRQITTPERFRRDLAEFARLADRHGFRLLFIDYPLRPLRENDQVAQQTARFFAQVAPGTYYRDHARLQAVVRAVSRQERVPLLRTRRELVDPRRFGFSDDIVHPNAVGMQTTARLIFERLREEGWLEAPERG